MSLIELLSFISKLDPFFVLLILMIMLLGTIALVSFQIMTERED